jgi:hypothetical protein
MSILERVEKGVQVCLNLDADRHSNKHLFDKIGSNAFILSTKSHMPYFCAGNLLLNTTLIR